MSLVLPTFLQRQTQPIDLMSLVWSPSKETQDCGKECLGKKFQCQRQFRTIECFYLINTLTKQMSLDKSSSLVAPEIRPIHKKWPQKSHKTRGFLPPKPVYRDQCALWAPTPAAPAVHVLFTSVFHRPLFLLTQLVQSSPTGAPITKTREDDTLSISLAAQCHYEQCLCWGKRNPKKKT